MSTVVQQHGSGSSHEEPSEAAIWEQAAREGFEELITFIRHAGEAGSTDARAVFSRLAVLGAALVKSLEARRGVAAGARRPRRSIKRS